MKLYVKVIAYSEEEGIKSTREEVVEIPTKVLKLNEAVMGKGNPGDILEGFATSALVAALGTVRIGGPSKAQEIISGTGTGPIGGRGPVNEDGQSSDPLAAALGLDIIEAMDQKEGPARRQAGPGPIGFGPHRSR
jgi:hypothetical protein